MASELDQIKTTITLSLGTKNRLRKLKGNRSYEEFINYLVRVRNKKYHSDNLIEIQKFTRKKATFKLEMKHIITNSQDSYTILFSYNDYNDSPNFLFDIKIETTRDKTGRKVAIKHLTNEILSVLSDKENLRKQYIIYFMLLERAIQQTIDSQFKHKGRFEDYYLWENEFNILNLPKKSFEEDVMEKLENFNQKIGAFE